MEFLIIAHDGTDPDAPERRRKARPAHIEAADRLRRAGNLIVGGAILNDGGEMIGSTAIVDFDDRAALDEWLRGDPYVTGDVWRDISVKPFRIAIGPRAAALRRSGVAGGPPKPRGGGPPRFSTPGPDR